MAITKIEEVYLYVSDETDNPAENLQARAFMDHSEIPHTSLYYNDPSQWPDVFSSVNSWFASPANGSLPPVTKFPFLTYVTVRDDLPARYSPVQYLEGLDAIKTFPDIYNQYNS